MTEARGDPSGRIVQLNAQDIELVIFDLDGVLTQTSRLHVTAWKSVFDAFISRHRGPDAASFDPVDDYLDHVDGKPRLQGVRDFLASRGWSLPEGDVNDPPGHTSLWAIGNAKNQVFNSLLERDGVETYAPAEALLSRLAQCGIRRAVVSASRNCRRILHAAGLADRFETVLGGEEAAAQRLAGKPAPDTFLAAAGRLGVPPGRAAVIEDSHAGVAAAHAGGFGLVIGVNRARHAAGLRAHGADHVVESLDELCVRPLPCALDSLVPIGARLRGARNAVFLDYDGTLTPIVDRPEDALLGDAMRKTVADLARRCPVALVSGRGLETIRDLVGLEEVIYVADHGFRVQFPGEPSVEPGPVAGYEGETGRVAEVLRERLAGLPGVLLEVKRYSIAVHYRLAAEVSVAEVKRVVDKVLASTAGLRLLPGKKVLELQADLEWDKGSAVGWLLDRLRVDVRYSVYVGDDLTDESAFRALADKGITVAVQPAPRPTAARLRLADVDGVRRFLKALSLVLAPESRG